MARSFCLSLGLCLVVIGLQTLKVSQTFRVSQGQTYYIRTDGGTPAQCTGRADAAYGGAGTGQPCAWDHPFRALPPGGAPAIAGGDTLIIGPGAYMLGYGAAGAEACDAGGAFDCHMPAIPSGPDPAHPTRMVGAGWNSGCAAPPQLWGTGRPWHIVDLTGSNNVELGCLEITDHSPCVEFHSGGLACERDTVPYGPWASVGLAAADSANVYLHHLNIHGLASQGVLAGRLRDWRVEDVRIAGNGTAGWDGDISGTDANAGTLLFRRLTIEWNGCGETYPGGQPAGCWAQTAGGYGDGLGTGESGGHWIFEDSIIRYNTSDGLDLLYIREPGSAIEIRRTLAVGNAGNQIKNYRGPFTLENSVVVGNCGFFEGQPFTFNVDACRALGVALALGLTGSDTVTVTNNTLTGEGDCLVVAECREPPCTAAARAVLRNNVFQGQVDFGQSDERACLVYQETFPADPFDLDYAVIAGVKEDLCPGSHSICGGPVGVVHTGVDTFDAHLLPASPAIGAALAAVAPRGDFDHYARDARPDIGAYEFGAHPPRLDARRIYLPLLLRS